MRDLPVIFRIGFCELDPTFSEFDDVGFRYEFDGRLKLPGLLINEYFVFTRIPGHSFYECSTGYVRVL